MICVLVVCGLFVGKFCFCVVRYGLVNFVEIGLWDVCELWWFGYVLCVWVGCGCWW